MNLRPKATYIGVAAGIVFLMAAHVAGASRLSASARLVRAVWPEESKLSFSNTAGGIEIACAVTMEGSFHASTIAKTTGSLVGYITRAIQAPIETCLKNNVTNVVVLTASLPWHVRYDSFTGTLPSITGIRFQTVGVAILVTSFGASCLYRSTAASPAFGIANREAGGGISGLQADSASEIPLASGGFLCPASATHSGTATRVTVLSETSSIRVSLI
ncbi:MAG TPA: hypothetical protein VFF79_06875 [Conexibacter sp.]|jgi:hypothetical protein|nr:hypothetical protein [Conexibacter sp.]